MIADEIIQKAKDYPDRPAIVRSNGEVVLYKDFTTDFLHEEFFTTSGTTGERKWIQIDDGAQRIRNKAARVIFDWDAYNSIFCAPSIESSIGHKLYTMSFLDGRTIYAPSFGDIDAAAAMCKEHSVEAMHYTNLHPLCRGLFDHLGGFSFKRIFVGGSVTPVETLQRLQTFGSVRVIYSASEVGHIAFGDLSDTKGILGCVGKVAPGVEVRIDPDGRIAIKSPTSVNLYADDPQNSAARFIDGWFYPNDKGHFEGDLLVVEGRA